MFRNVDGMNIEPKTVKYQSLISVTEKKLLLFNKQVAYKICNNTPCLL